MANKTDIWMPLYIGDYLADTSHLDAERSGAYLHLLMHYWRKGPLTSDLDALVSVARLRGPDAASIAQALLAEFFTLAEDELWHQGRSDSEIAKWQNRAVKAQEKARVAARARWPVDAPCNASSTPQAMLGLCPSPSPLPKEQKQVPSAKLKPSPDPRTSVFRTSFENYYRTENRIPAPWDAQEGTRLKKWLAANPTITADQWVHILNNRHRSPVTHAKRLSSWLDVAASWLSGTADDWGKPKSNGDSKNGRVEGNADSLRIALSELANSDSGIDDNAGENHLLQGGNGQPRVFENDGRPTIEGKP